MSPQIIAGSAKGIKLEVPKGCRPITNTAKSAMFSMLADDIIDKRILDLYAGSGSLGLEALSRGAKSCVFVDNSFHASEILRINTQKTGLELSSQIVKMGVGPFVDDQPPETFDIVFADPPFDILRRKNSVLKLIPRYLHLIPEGGGLLIKHPKECLPESYENLKLADTRCFGQSCFSTWVKMSGLNVKQE